MSSFIKPTVQNLDILRLISDQKKKAENPHILEANHKNNLLDYRNSHQLFFSVNQVTDSALKCVYSCARGWIFLHRRQTAGSCEPPDDPSQKRFHGYRRMMDSCVWVEVWRSSSLWWSTLTLITPSALTDDPSFSSQSCIPSSLLPR